MYESTTKMGFAASDQKPHAVCIPFPAQGHINPMLKLSMVLHYRGFHITFVNTDFNHNRLLKSRGSNSLDGLPDFRFHSIPDGLPPTEADVTQDIPTLCFSTARNCLVPFRELLHKLDQNSSSLNSVDPPVTCIISDAVMTFTLIAAEEIGVPCVSFRTTTACCFMLNKQYSHLKEKVLLPLKDARYLTNEHLNMTVDWIPGIKNICLKDFPSFVQTTNLNDKMVEFTIGEAERASTASAVIFNTFHELECDVLQALSSTCSPIYSIGPVRLLINKLPLSKLKPIGSNLWKEDTECLKWLDSKQLNSVIYINYGSITVMTKEKLVEFAWGLANSKHNFLWVIRPDLIVGETAILPPEFYEEIKERGLIAGWCPQEEVLDHVAVGGFLTHCGWNSMIESLSCGVPMICWPFFADQPTNCKLACSDWGVGMEIGKNVRRDELEMHVRELMGGEKGKAMRKKAMEWKKKAEEATGEFGSSSLNLDKLVRDVL